MPDNQNSNIPWWAIVLGFIFCWPVGLVLLFLNLGGVNIPAERIRRDLEAGSQAARSRLGKQGQAGAAKAQTPPQAGAQSQSTYRYTYQSGPTAQAGAGSGAQTPPQAGAQKQTASRYTYRYGQTAQAGAGAQTPPTAQAGAQQSQPRWKLRRFLKEPKSGKGMTVVGALMTFVFSIGFVPVFSKALEDGLLHYAAAWFPLLGFLCAGLFLLCKGISKTRISRRMRLYQGVIGQRNSVFLSDLASSAGVSEKKVISDVQKMIADGFLPMGYIDKVSDRLVLTDQGYDPPAPERPRAEAKAETKAAAGKEDPDAALLRQIREVNDAIPDPEMSRKIARIEEITGKILDYQKKDPAKAPQLRQFLNYYLPTTLKILNAYARMDAQGIDGENISAAKHRIEGMMDKVVEGFEKQLDQLFQADAMDITTDVDVLERMLDKDGLGGGMTMGG